MALQLGKLEELPLVDIKIALLPLVVKQMVGTGIGLLPLVAFVMDLTDMHLNMGTQQLEPLVGLSYSLVDKLEVVAVDPD